MSRKIAWFVLATVVVGLFISLFALQKEFTMPENFPVLDRAEIGDETPAAGPGLATFGSGCFWCTEAVFQQLKGVQKVVSGYSGGSVKNPTYEQVCGGRTGHAEVIQITYDPAVISYPELLEVFWRSHDPTTPDRQGVDTGPQYRSAIFTHTERQQQLAELYKKKINAAQVFSKPVVTEIAPFTEFYPAEMYHQNYYASNRRDSYCSTMIRPKVDKLKAVFADKIKPDAP